MEAKKLKICFLAATLGKGGAEKQAYYFLKTLSENGHQLKLFYFEPDDWWKEPMMDLGVSITHITETSKKARIKRIHGLIRKDKYDIIQALHYHMNPYAVLLALIFRAKSVGAFRGDGQRELLKVNKYIRAITFNLGSAFICNSQRTINRLASIRSLKGKLHYLPNVVEIPDEVSTNESDLPTNFICVNSLINLKRIDLILKFIDRFRRINPSVQLKVLGSGPLRSSLEEMAQDLKITAHVTFVGQVDNVADYYKEADVFLLASESEGTPNVVLEAMSHSKVIISSNVGDVPFLITHNKSGFILNYSDDNQLEEFCQMLISNWQGVKQVGAEARQSVLKNNTYAGLYARLHNVYERF